MSDKQIRQKAAEYLGRTRHNNVPERAIVVPPLLDAQKMAKHLTGYKLSVNEYMNNTGLATGKYKDEPVSVFVCGVGSWQANWSMGVAAPLFKKAIFLGSSGSIDEEIKLGEFVIPTVSFSSYFKELECPDSMLPETLERLSVAYPNERVMGAIKEKMNKRNIAFVEGIGYSTDADYRQQEIMLADMRKKVLTVVEREHKNILDISARSKIDAAALLYVTDRLGKENPSDNNNIYWDIAYRCMETAYPVILDALISD